MSHRYRLLSTCALGVAVMGALHWLAGMFFWYWSYPGFDKFMHFLGGLSLGLFALWFWYASGILGRGAPTRREAFTTALVVVLCIGIGWEFFEYVYNIANPAAGLTYGQDTFWDLMFDLFGAGVAGIIGRTKSFYE